MHLNDAELVSVIILSFGPGEQYERTLLSVLEQDYPAIDLIISDDASESFQAQDVERFVRTHMRENVKRLLVRRNERNLGIPAHDNLTAKLAKGKFIKFVADGDVFCNPCSLTRLYQFAASHAESVVTSPCIVSDASLTVSYYQYPSPGRVKILNTKSTGALYGILAFSNLISAVGCMFRQEFFYSGGFDESYRYLEDWPTWLRMMREGNRIPCAEEPSECYAMSGINSTYNTAFDSPKLRQDLLRCYEEEILANQSRLSWWILYYVRFRYTKLKNGLNTRKKLYFAPAIAYCSLKAMVKKMVMHNRNGG